jgi:hypothetical protein
MFGIKAELQDIPLSDAYVLEQLPSRIGGPFRLLPPKRGRKIRQSGLQVDMGLAATQQIDDVFT